MGLWRSLRGFFEQVLAPAPESPPAAAVIDPRDAAPSPQLAAHRSAAQAALLGGRLDEAAEAATVALELQPGDPLATYLLGRARLRQGRADEARRLYQAAAGRDPFGLVAGWLAELDRAEAELAGARPSSAEQTAIEQERAARAALRAGRLPEARAAAEAAVRLDPANLMAHHLLGCAWLAAGDVAAAVATFEAARAADQVGLVDAWIAAAREGRLPLEPEPGIGEPPGTAAPDGSRR